MARPTAVVESQVRQALQSHDLRQAVLLVAVSAGADSTALLHALHALQAPMSLTLHVAHFDHNFRPEAAADARFVAGMAADLGLPFMTEHADPMAYQREQRISSFEAAARELRYRFLGRAADSVGASAIALGHNASDQAETVLMHLIRGSGLDGLRGMGVLTTWRSSGGDQRANLFRPLLAVPKEQLRDYCDARGIAFREDPANRDLRFTRNRVRHLLLPFLREYNPRISESLTRLAQTVSQEVDFLEAETARAWAELARMEEDAIVLDRVSLASRPPALQVRLLRRAYQRMAGSGRRLRKSHVDAMVGLLHGGPGREVGLPLQLRLTSAYDTLTMRRGRSPHASTTPLEGEHRLAVPAPGGPAAASPAAVTLIPGWRVTVEWVDSAAGVPANSLEAIMDLGDAAPELWVRGRRRGDRFHPHGMAGNKKLQDFLVDAKAPASQRDAIPLVVGGAGIAWVVSYRVAQWATVKPSSRRALHIRFEAAEGGPA